MPRYRVQIMPKRVLDDRTLIAVGQRIAWLREALGHTQADWARRLRISAPRLSKWEAGEQLPNLNTLITICDASSVSMDYFFRGIVTVGTPAELVAALHRSHSMDLQFRVLPPLAQS